MTPPPVFYLGAHHPTWLWNGEMDCRLFVSHGRLRDRKSAFPAAVVPGWALDSRGFTELQIEGRWTVTPREYVEATARYDREIGRLEWAAGQDSMCEPPIFYGGVHDGQRFAGTRQFIDPDGNLSYPELVLIHQRMTTVNHGELERLWPEYSDAECPYMPTLQGEIGKPESYLRHESMYAEAGIRLADYPVVGVGSVCRLQSDRAVSRLSRGLAQLDLPLHWFGLKITGLPYVWPNIASHDSQAWSRTARREPRMDGCTHVRVRGKYTGQPSTCANCPRRARKWQAQITALTASLERLPVQEELFGIFEGAA